MENFSSLLILFAPALLAFIICRTTRLWAVRFTLSVTACVYTSIGSNWKLAWQKKLLNRLYVFSVVLHQSSKAMPQGMPAYRLRDPHRLKYRLQVDTIDRTRPVGLLALLRRDWQIPSPPVGCRHSELATAHRISATAAPIGTGFLDASVLQRSMRCLTTSRVTRSSNVSKSTSSHFNPRISPTRRPVDAPSRTAVFGRSNQFLQEEHLQLLWREDGGYTGTLRALPDVPNGIRGDPLPSQSVTVQGTHDVPNLRLRSPF